MVSASRSGGVVWVLSMEGGLDRMRLGLYSLFSVSHSDSLQKGSVHIDLVAARLLNNIIEGGDIFI